MKKGILTISNPTGNVSFTVNGISESQGETWVINENPTLQPFVATYESSIFKRFDCNVTTSGGVTYKYMTLGAMEGRPSVYRLATIGFQNDPTPYPSTIYSLGWEGPYPVIATITFETSPTGELLAWLQENAVKQS